MARAFAAAYARYLSGTGSAAALPQATAATRQTAGSAGRPPAAPITLSSVSLSGSSTWTVVFVDGRHRLEAQLLMAKPPGGWIVNMLIPPDFSTQLQPARRISSLTRAPGSEAPLRATRAFLRVYLALSQATVPRLHDVTQRLRAQLARDAPPSAGPLRARVLVIPIRHRGLTWIATPSLTNGTNTYQLTITLIKGGRGQWLVEAVTQQ